MKAVAILAVTITVVLLGTQCAQADEVRSDAARLVDQYMAELRSRATKTVQTKDILAGNPDAVLCRLELYETDSDRTVRYETWNLEWRLAVRSTDPAFTRKVTSKLVNALTDKDKGVANLASRYLMGMSSEDFSPESKEIVRRLASGKKGEGVVLLSAVVGLNDQMPFLRGLLKDEQEKRKEGYGVWWRARIALARLGSSADTAECIRVVESEKDPLYLGTLLKYLALTHQPEVIPVLQRYLDSDSILAPEGEDHGPLYAREEALKVLALFLQDFPVRDRGYYPKKDIATAREWMRKQDQFTFKKHVEAPLF